MATSNENYSWLANQPMQRKVLLAVGSLIALFTISGLATLVALQRQADTRHWTTHTYQVLLKLNQTARTLQESQIGERGYLLNQQSGELQDFERNDRALGDELAQLRALTIDNPLQQVRIDKLQSMAGQWQAEAHHDGIDPIDQVKSDDPNAAQQRLGIQRDYLAHRSVLMSDLINLIDQMSDTERTLLDERTASLDRDVTIVATTTIVSLLLALLFGGLAILASLRLITRPIRRMTDLMTRLAEHDHSVKIDQLQRRDEIGEIARALQVFKQMAIDTGAQTWVKTHVSEIAGALQTVTTRREFAERLTSELAPLLHSGVSIFYQYSEEQQRLELTGSYGYQERRHLSTSYALGEGLVGQCALERQPITLQDVPDNYVRIHSGTGEASPRSISVLPLLLRDKLLGVLELASFQHFSESQQRLLTELLPIVALSLENLDRAIRTQDLLRRTSEQADELRTSEEVLRRQQQDLQATNEELNAKTHELQEQSQRLLASEEELRVQTEELQASNEELRQKTDTLNQQKHVLESLQRETQDKAEELARASQYKSEFLANMSHELRTPLNSLLILSRSLADNRDGNLNEEEIESSRIIHDSGSNLLRLINDILDLSKVESGKMELSLSDYPLSTLQRTLTRTFSHVAQEKKLAFEVYVDDGLPATLRTDATKLEQVANNLIGNAFKFTGNGSVKVRIGRPQATIALPERLLGKAVIAIAVTDTGIGIPPAKFQKIFHAFEQVDASTSRQYGGTGLGLTISRSMAELLGGDIVLESREGEGSTFTILLPEQAPQGQTADIEGKPASAEPAPVPRAPAISSALLPESIEDDRDHLAPGDTAILIVEDDPVFARILADMVHRKGYRALAAADGESGLQLAQHFKPTGILLDVMLPGMDGWTVIEQLKADNATRHIPVHFISAVDEASRGRELGAVGFLTKPVSREAIGGAFERLLHFAEGSTRHLLIVDDDTDSRAAVRKLLRDDGVLIDEAGSAEEAQAKIAETRYDCVVLDLGLPGMSGVELLEKLSSTGDIPPVVIYSGRDLDREESLKLRQYTDSIVVKGARSPERLLDEVSLFLHSIRDGHRHAQPRPAAGQSVTNELAGREVLLVDDDMRNLFALSKVLRDWGMNVTMAQDGQKALKTLADHRGIELVLMDIMMPVMDGYETIRAIRAQSRFGKLPIIALTAKAMRGDREKCLEAGANDYLSKPIDIDKLSSMMHVWLHR